MSTNRELFYAAENRITIYSNLLTLPETIGIGVPSTWAGVELVEKTQGGSSPCSHCATIFTRSSRAADVSESGGRARFAVYSVV